MTLTKNATIILFLLTGCYEEKIKVTQEQFYSEAWIYNGEFHNDEEPAVIHSDGTKLWYNNGLLHRVDGPAVELPNGTKEWWINGKRQK